MQSTKIYAQGKNKHSSISLSLPKLKYMEKADKGSIFLPYCNLYTDRHYMYPK